MKKLLAFIILGITVLFSSNAQNYPNIVNYYMNGTPTNGVKIKTNLPFTNGSQMPTININGYAYGSANVINLSIVYYIYNNAFTNYGVSSFGGYSPRVYLSNENSKVVIYIDDKCYYERFNVSVYANGMQENSHPEWFQSWTVADEPLSGTSTVECNYSNKFKDIDVAGKILINGVQTVYTPSSLGAVGTYYFGNGGGNLTHTSGNEGYYNTAVGERSLFSNTTGSTNTSLGAYSLGSNTIGIANTAQGAFSLNANTSGNNNSANGYASLLSNTTGSNNIANGTDAGRYIANGSTPITISNQGVYLGAGTKALTDNSTNEIVIGYNAIGNGSNSATIGNSRINKTILSGNVGMGIANPQAKLHVYANDSTNSNLVIASFERYGTPTGGSGIVNLNYGTSSAKFELNSLYTGAGIKFGSYADLNIVNNTKGGAHGALNFITNDTCRLSIQGNGNIGVGTTNPTQLFSVQGRYGNPAISGVVQKGIAAYGSSDTYATLYIGNFVSAPYGMWLQASARNNLSVNHPISINPNGGNVGIGTSNPVSKLHIESGANTDAAILATSDENNKLVLMSQTTQPANVSTFKLVQDFGGNRNNGYISFHRGTSVYGGFLEFGTNGLERLRVDANGNVGIGTTNPQNTLDVKGTIRATEVKVESVDKFADFVFDKQYKLPTLNEVQNYINENGHLKDIPSGSEVRENGMSLTEMNVKLLQKVEELTLYAIKQQKQIDQQQKQIDELKSKVK